MRIKYPEMRKELIGVLSSLSDIKYQQMAWVKHGLNDQGKMDNFDVSVHFLFDDMQLDIQPQRLIGGIFMNEKECELTVKVVSAIDDIFDRYGTDLSDEQYMKLPEWSAVLVTAKKAYDYIICDS